MPLKFEIYQALFVALGVIQVLTNSVYLLKDNGLTYARKQHRELPTKITDRQILIKVMLMFGFGTAFLIIGIYSFYKSTFFETMAFTSLLLFAIYGTLEAMYYRHWKTTGFAILSIVILIIYMFS